MIIFGSEVNVITLTFVAELGFVIEKIDVGAQKIDSSPLVTYGMVLAGFSVSNKLEKVWFFEKTFLLANTNMEVVLKMFFLIFSNANIQFGEKKLK